MKFYIATRYSTVRLRNKTITLRDELEKHGHEMTFDWTNTPSLRPYEENEVDAAKYAEIDIQAAVDADIFILLPCPDGTGMYVEYGAAIASHLLRGTPRIFILGDNKNCSMFNYHPAAEWVDSLEEILTLLDQS